MYFVYECIIIKDFCPLVKVTKSQQHFCFKLKISNKIMVFIKRFGSLIHDQAFFQFWFIFDLRTNLTEFINCSFQLLTYLLLLKYIFLRFLFQSRKDSICNEISGFCPKSTRNWYLNDLFLNRLADMCFFYSYSKSEKILSNRVSVCCAFCCLVLPSSFSSKVNINKKTRQEPCFNQPLTYFVSCN